MYDRVAGAYLPCFLIPNEALAVRAIIDCLRDEKHNFAMHPEDYSLWQIGHFDDSTGEVEPDQQLVIECAELLRNMNQTEMEL